MTVLKFIGGFLVIPAMLAILFGLYYCVGIVWMVAIILFIASIGMGLGCAGFPD